MKINIRSKNISIPTGLQAKIEKKLNRLDKYFFNSEDIDAKVVVRNYPGGQKIEVTIPTDDVILRAEVMDHDTLNAIDSVIEKLEGQIRKYKTKLSRRLKDKTTTFDFESIEPVDAEDVIVKTKTINPKPMDLEEAIMQMELVGHSFFVYKDTETDSISVVYKRQDGDYGLIETE